MVPAPSRLGVCVESRKDARAVAVLSRGALNRPLASSAELTVCVVSDEATLLGAFQRRLEGAPAAYRRGSGGPELRVGEGTVHVALALETPSALVPCDEKRIVNRYVRPLLRGLTKCGHSAHYFGRDWISVGHQPAGWTGFAHDATTQRTLFEAFVAVRIPFTTDPRSSFMGKTATTLERLAAGAIDAHRVAVAIVDAYASGLTTIPLEWPAGVETDALDVPSDPPWAASAEIPIGTLSAGRDHAGVLRLGGELLASRDAVARLEALAANASPADLPRIIDETLGAPGVALEGLRSLASVLEVLERAR